MSEIPFVKALGDELERKIAARRGRIRRRIVIGGLGFAIAATGVAAASGVFTGTPEQLASNAVGCFERADLNNSSASILSTGDETPIETCRRVLKTDGPLVACAGEAVFVFPGRPGTCERLGLEPLPPEYDTARARVLVLERELAALEATADCVPLDEFAERAQGVLDRLGWAGWRAHVRDDLGRGPCGSALGYNGDGSRSIEGTMIADERYLIVMPGPRRSTLDLLDGPGVRVMDASGDRCYDVEGVKQLVRDRLPAGGRRAELQHGHPPGRHRHHGRARRSARGGLRDHRGLHADARRPRDRRGDLAMSGSIGALHGSSGVPGQAAVRPPRGSGAVRLSRHHRRGSGRRR